MPEVDELELYKKSQKLLDRFLFIFFAEDKGLLPPNSISVIVDDWNRLRDLDEYKPLYSRFQKYFGYLNDGFKGMKYEIHAYNGGLFKPDPLLDGLTITDEVLEKHVLKLTEYDFESEVDTNILGHIFEHSLNDIENVRAQLAGEEVDKSKTRRKKEGVFYTPKYITKYIVDNTLGKLCEEKKQEIGIDEEEFAKERKGRRKETLKKLDAQLKAYREWLLQLTICDPACGSGAFLNQALEFLIAEHRSLDEMGSQLLGNLIVFPDVENHILERNIYGVDINEESVEIARLSLWLRTAKKGRKLTSLSGNIKIGNSLIDDPKVAGELAFNWQEQFPSVFREKEKRAYHITTATHDSRTSERMVEYKAREKRDDGSRPDAQPIWLEPDDELHITQTIAEIVKENGLNVLAFNICGDHMHMLLVCEEDEVADIVRKVKGKTSRKLHSCKEDEKENLEIFENKGFKPLVNPVGNSLPLGKPRVESSPIKKSIPLWTQKFGCKEIKNHDQLVNTIEYIRNNRLKHNLTPNLKISDTKGIGEDSALRQNKGFKPLVKSFIEIIDDFTTTVEHAFRTEYKGGFDVVIGNPPYVSANEVKKFSTKEQYNFLKSNYETAKGTVDLYVYFFERGMNVLRPNGYLSYITPNRFLSASYGTALREHIISNYEIDHIVDYSDKKVFPDASTYPVITVLVNRSGRKYNVHSGKFNDLTKQFEGKLFPSNRLQIIDNSILGFLLNNKLPITEKIINQSDTLGIAGVINATSTASEADEYSSLINEDSGYKLINTGTIDPYVTTWGREELTDKGNKYLFPYLPKDSTIISANRYNLYSSPKIIISKIGLKCEAFYDRNGEYASINTNCIHSFSDDFVPEYLLAWLNSKLYNYTFECLFDGLRMSGGYLLFSSPNLKSTSIKKANLNKQIEFVPLARKVEKQILAHLEIKANFIEHFTSKFLIENPSKKLQNWQELNFKGFLEELNKAKVQLSLEKEAEWMQYFNKKKAEANALQTEINRIGRQIDQMVYELYGLTDEEIKIVENS